MKTDDALGDALVEAQVHLEEKEEYTGTVSMQRWTRWLPEWAFQELLDFQLKCLRVDMLEHYRKERPCPVSTS